MVSKGVKEANGLLHRHHRTEMQTIKRNKSRFDMLIKFFIAYISFHINFYVNVLYIQNSCELDENNYKIEGISQ